MGIWTWPGRLISLKNRIQDLSASQLIFQSRCFWVHCHQTSHYSSYSGKDSFNDKKGRWIQTQGSSTWGGRANHKAITKAFSIFKCFLRKDQFMFVPGEENRNRKKRWIKKKTTVFQGCFARAGPASLPWAWRSRARCGRAAGAAGPASRARSPILQGGRNLFSTNFSFFRPIKKYRSGSRFNFCIAKIFHVPFFNFFF